VRQANRASKVRRAFQARRGRKDWKVRMGRPARVGAMAATERTDAMP
jgi:hypothetical protein